MIGARDLFDQPVHAPAEFRYRASNRPDRAAPAMAIRGDRRSLFLSFTKWVPILDGDDAARELFDQHYSRYVYADGRKPKLFVGPGEKMVLTTPCRRALFVWRNFISGDGQVGVNCAIFSNRGGGLSSDLIRDADALADARWPGERHFTYVNPRKTAGRRSKNSQPGHCFIMAGWRPCGITKKRKLLILERLAP